MYEWSKGEHPCVCESGRLSTNNRVFPQQLHDTSPCGSPTETGIVAVARGPRCCFPPSDENTQVSEGRSVNRVADHAVKGSRSPLWSHLAVSSTLSSLLCLLHAASPSAGKGHHVRFFAPSRPTFAARLIHSTEGTHCSGGGNRFCVFE